MARKLSIIGLILSALTLPPAMAADTGSMPDDRSETSSRSAGRTIDDATITTKVKSAFVKDDKVSALDVKVNTYRGIVQLSGFVDSAESKKRAEEIAKSVDGVKSVKNDLQLRQ